MVDKHRAYLDTGAMPLLVTLSLPRSERGETKGLRACLEIRGVTVLNRRLACSACRFHDETGETPVQLGFSKHTLSRFDVTARGKTEICGGPRLVRLGFHFVQNDSGSLA